MNQPIINTIRSQRCVGYAHGRSIIESVGEMTIFTTRMDGRALGRAMPSSGWTARPQTNRRTEG